MGHPVHEGDQQLGSRRHLGDEPRLPARGLACIAQCLEPREPVAHHRAGLRSREPSVLREPAFEFACRWRAAGEGARLDAGDARIGQHNAGKGSAYTRSRRPVELVHSELADDRSSAQRREAAIKRLPVSLKRSLIQAGS